MSEEILMQSDIQTASVAKWQFWLGVVISAFVTVALVLSGVLKLAEPENLRTEFDRLGYPQSVILGIGITEIACALLYAIPQTSVLGAILLTGYLGGATATNVRVGDIFIFPIIGGILVWGGLYLRDLRIRALVPLRSKL